MSNPASNFYAVINSNNVPIYTPIAYGLFHHNGSTFDISNCVNSSVSYSYPTASIYGAYTVTLTNTYGFKVFSIITSTNSGANAPNISTTTNNNNYESPYSKVGIYPYQSATNQFNITAHSTDNSVVSDDGQQIYYVIYPIS